MFSLPNEYYNFYPTTFRTMEPPLTLGASYLWIVWILITSNTVLISVTQQYKIISIE